MIAKLFREKLSELNLVYGIHIMDIYSPLKPCYVEDGIFTYKYKYP